jgi:phosphoribosylamine--glycine ligase
MRARLTRLRRAHIVPSEAMKVLVIGGGGREHALCWKLRQSPQVQQLWCAPGNAGIAQDAECVAADSKDVAGLVQMATRLKPDLVVVGPEQPLVGGLVDELGKAGIPAIGPTRQAAQLEGSKIFAKEFLLRQHIPTTPMYGWHDSAAKAYSDLCSVEWPMVIKADGLCGGKGVLVAQDPDEATAFLERVMEQREFGSGGDRVLLEEALTGQELSYIILTDGKRYAPLVPTRDHKRVLDGDRGPNTGGMGAFSADALLPPALDEVIRTRIVEPTLQGLASEGLPYRGFLYFGLMLTAAGPMVLEFNCRMGDPEAQAIVVRMDFDLAAVLQCASRGELAPADLRWKAGASACVVMASAGYPGEVAAGKPIQGLTGATEQGGGQVFHAGTEKRDNNYYTSSGRVLGICASAPALPEALQKAYALCGTVSFEGAQYRKDIGASARAAGN